MERYKVIHKYHDHCDCGKNIRILFFFIFNSKLYAEKHSNVSILYADVVRYTQMTSQLPVRTLVETLHELFVKFDEASAVSSQLSSQLNVN
jgi:hypothetical protein